MLKKIFFTFIFFCLFIEASFSIDRNNSYFDLNSIVDAVLTTINENENISSVKFIELQKKYEEITQKFLQGNIVVAYDEYTDFLDKIDNDMVFLNLGENFYKLGLFSIGDEAINRIKHVDEIKSQISDLKKSYIPKNKLSIDEEKQFAKNYVAINYENYAQETSFELGKERELLNKSDYANYLMAQAQVQLKQYHYARKFIDNAISINPHNANYALYKVKILSLEGKYKEGLSYLKKLKKNGKITNSLFVPFSIEEEYIKSYIAKDSTEKAVHNLNVYYLRNENYKAIKECEDILGTDKNNFKIMTHLARNYIKIGDITKAEENAQKAYEMNKKYPLTLEVLGDISFINYDYKKAERYYLDSNKKAKKAELYDKLALTNFMLGNTKNVDRYSHIVKKIKPGQFYDLYDISSTVSRYAPILSDGVSLSDEFLKKTIYLNPLFKEAWLDFAQDQMYQEHFKMAENIMIGIGTQIKPDFNYYHVNAILCEKLGKFKEAVLNLEKSIDLNPDFKPARELKIRLEGEL